MTMVGWGVFGMSRMDVVVVMIRAIVSMAVEVVVRMTMVAVVVAAAMGLSAFSGSLMPSCGTCILYTGQWCAVHN